MWKFVKTKSYNTIVVFKTIILVSLIKRLLQYLTLGDTYKIIKKDVNEGYKTLEESTVSPFLRSQTETRTTF